MRGALDLEVATEFLLIAAMLLELKTRRLLPGREDVELDEELPCGRSGTCCWPACSSARRSRTPRPSWPGWPTGQRSLPRRAGLDDRFIDLAPDLLAGVTPEQLRAGLPAGH